jgi:PAS domain S-box-containing protein
MCWPRGWRAKILPKFCFFSESHATIGLIGAGVSQDENYRGIFLGREVPETFSPCRGQVGRLIPVGNVMEEKGKSPVLWWRLLLVALTIIVAMTGFEFIKNLFSPHVSLWKSHIITIIFVSVIGTVFAYFILKKLSQLDQNRLDRQQSEQALKSGYTYLQKLLDERTAHLAKANEALRYEFLEHQHDAAALRFSEAQSRVVADQANSIILRLNLKGEVTFFNKFSQSLFGFSEDEICGSSVIGTIVPETDTAGRNLAVMIADLISHPDRYTINENENIKRNGERIWVSWTNKAILDDYGQVIEILCIGNEKTPFKTETETINPQKNDG